jgi:hypothetical protein
MQERKLVKSQVMKIILLAIIAATTIAQGFSQVKSSVNAGHILNDSTAGIKVFNYPDGRYCFTFQNVLSEKGDPCSFFVKNQQEAKAFLQEIKKAFLLKEGMVNNINYGNSQIMLMLASTGAVFMKVQQKGGKLAAYAINRLTLAQIDVLK